MLVEVGVEGKDEVVAAWVFNPAKLVEKETIEEMKASRVHSK